jgi:hypothetical protein
MSKHPEYTIITNAPLPENHGVGRKAIYPFRKMKIGQAFDAAADKRKSILNAANWAGFKVVTAIQPNGKVRVWLTGKRPPRKPQARKGGNA